MIARNLTARIELLSDVHIGTGTELVRDFDWIAPGDGFVYISHSDRLMEEVFRRAEADGREMREVAKTLAGSTLTSLYRELKWLTQDDFTADSPLFRYRLRGSPATANIREQIKDVFGRPYLPGSSLKGALRTALAVAAAEELKPDLTKLEYSRSWAARPVEGRLFGRDPNHDLLRALQVGDSQPVDSAHLVLKRAHIYPTATSTYRGQSRGLDVDVEALGKGTVIELPIHVPTELLVDRGTPFDRRRHAELSDWESRVPWLERLARTGKKQSIALLTEEANFFRDRDKAEVAEAQQFLGRLVQQFQKLGPNEFYLVLGWGGGWHTKTLNQVLKRDPKLLADLVSRYRMNRTGTLKPGAPFPKSRHLLRNRLGQAGPPLGWIKVTLQSAA